MLCFCYYCNNFFYFKYNCIRNQFVVFNYLSLKFNTMKTLTITLALLLGSMAFSQDIVYKNGLYIKNEAVYSGKYSNYFENGALKETLTIKDGKLNGEIIKYYEDGTKMEVGQFENNLKFGLWTRFNTGGSVIAEASYKNDKKDGTWLVYDDKGAKLFKMEYKEGEKIGTWQQWNENGEIIKTTSYSSM